MRVATLGRVLLPAVLVLLGGCEGGSTSDVGGERVVVITVTPTQPELQVGGTVQLEAVAKNVNLEVVPGADFVWSSFNPGVATVDANGLVTAVAPGAAIVDARILGVAVTAGSSSITVVSP